MSSPVIMEFKVGDWVVIVPNPENKWRWPDVVAGKKARVVRVDEKNEPAYCLREEGAQDVDAFWVIPEDVMAFKRREVAFKEVPPATVFYTRKGGMFLKLLEENGYNAACISPAGMPHTFLEGQLAFFYSGASVFLDPVS